MMVLTGYIACKGEKINSRRGLIRKHKNPLGRHRHRWENNIKMDNKEIVSYGMDGSHLSLGTYQWQALLNTNNFLESHKMWEILD